MNRKILFTVLGHGSPEAFSLARELWQKVAGDRHGLLLVHGGKEEDFAALDYRDKIRVDDSRLRTKQHPLEKQSYCGVWRAVAEWLGATDFDAVYFAEFDELPLVPDLADRLLNLMDQEKADVLARRLRRVDGTNDAHWLYHESDPLYRRSFEEVSQRDGPKVVLSMLGTGCFWKRRAFLEVAAHPESVPCYLELFLPTMAHHLGYRVRDFGPQSRYIGFDPKKDEELLSEIREGAWTVHPVKEREQWRRVEGLKG